MVNPAIETVSLLNVPATAPEPYRIVVWEPLPDAVLRVDDLVVSNRGVDGLQDLQDVSATHKSEEPVSRIT